MFTSSSSANIWWWRAVFSSIRSWFSWMESNCAATISKKWWIRWWMFRCYIHRRARRRKIIFYEIWYAKNFIFIRKDFILKVKFHKWNCFNNLRKDARAGRNKFKNTFFENMKNHKCALLYGRNSRYAYDTYQSEFNRHRIPTIFQANEWYWIANYW